LDCSVEEASLLVVTRHLRHLVRPVYWPFGMQKAVRGLLIGLFYWRSKLVSCDTTLKAPCSPRLLTIWYADTNNRFFLPMNSWRTHLPQGSCTCFDIHPDMLPVDMINVSPGLYAVLSWIGVVPNFTRARLQNWWAEVCKELYICIWVVSKLCSCPKKYQPGLRYELGTRLQTVHHVYQLTNRSHFGIIPESSLVAFTLIHRPTPHCFPDKPMSILSPLREWSPSFPVAIRYCVYKTLHSIEFVLVVTSDPSPLMFVE
jgi:hypothetical protein